MRAGPSSRSHLSRLALCLCAALVVVAPLARGGVDLPTEVAVLVLAAVAAACAACRYPFFSWSTAALAVVLGWMTLQLIPVPWQAHAVSPGAVSVFQLSLAELARYPAARPLALDLPASHRETAKATACLLLVIASAAYADTGRRKALLLRVLAASAVTVACVVLGGAVLGLAPLLMPSFPFVNANHLAGFLELTGFIVLALALEAKGGARLLWVVCFVAVVTVVVVSLSRAGIIVFGVGVAVFAIWTWKRRLAPPRTRAILLAGSVGAGLTAGAVLALSPALAELGSLTTSPAMLKFNMWPQGLAVLRDHAITGIGRGAFPTVFQAYRHDLARVVFTHLENEWLQALIDLGLPFGLFLLGALLWVWLAAARRATSIPEVGLLVGMLCLGIHSLFDFSIETLGVAVPFSVALGLLMCGARRIRVGRGILLGFVVVTASLGVAHQLRYGRAEARLAALTSSPLERLRQEGADVVADRPADYFPHAMVGVRLAQAGQCRDALPWLRRAMLLASLVPEPHAALGRCLARGPHDEQAKQEFGLAVALGDTAALATAVQVWTSLDDLYPIAGNTPDGLLALANALPPERSADAQLVLTRLLEEFVDERAALPLARVALRNGDLDTAVDAARRHQGVDSSEAEAYKIAGTALAKQGESAAARAEIERGLQVSPGSAELLTVVVAWEIAERKLREARLHALEIEPRSQRDVAIRHTLLAKILLARSRLPEAIVELQAAVVATPDDPWLFLFLGQLRARAGRTGEAIAALERAAALPGAPSEEIAARLAEVRRAGEVQEGVRPPDGSLPPESKP